MVYNGHCTNARLNCFYHDGITTGSVVQEVGHISELGDVGTYKNRNARLVVYCSESVMK